MSADDVWCVVVAKDFERAKSRLSAVLDDHARRELSRRMLLHVTSVCEAVLGKRVLVASDAEPIAHLARERGFAVLRDPEAGGLSVVIDAALRHLHERGARRALVLMADLPRLSARDVRTMLDALDGVDWVLAPDHARAGTNGLALQLAPETRTCFGRPDSFDAHQMEARQLRLSTVVVELPGLQHDLDNADDYARLKDAISRL